MNPLLILCISMNTNTEMAEINHFSYYLNKEIVMPYHTSNLSRTYNGKKKKNMHRKFCIILNRKRDILSQMKE